MVDVDDRFATRLSGWASSLAGSRPLPSSESALKDPLWAIDAQGLSTGGLARAQEAWATALDLWPDEEDAFDFLTRRHAMLEDQRPILVALKSSEGLRSVQSIIGRLRYGSAA